jgi:site-specific DNA-cytosine methylase
MDEADRKALKAMLAARKFDPRTYRFFGSLESKARKVGNAVPLLMAKVIGKAFLAHAHLGR